jgi:hypothetical protein
MAVLLTPVTEGSVFVPHEVLLAEELIKPDLTLFLFIIISLSSVVPIKFVAALVPELPEVSHAALAEVTVEPDDGTMDKVPVELKLSVDIVQSGPVGPIAPSAPVRPCIP